jgi:hypothetical protein
MAAEVDIYNIALARIGVFETAIQDVNEASKAANVCRMFFDSIRDYVLEDFPWPFAEKRVLLADLGTPPTNWDYKYAYPADCLSAKYIAVEGARNPRDTQKIPFRIANDADVKVILCDWPDAELVYTAQVTDLNLWTNCARSALAYRLAAEIAMPMSVKPDIANSAMNGYYREKSIAAANTMNEGQPDAQPESEFIAIRGTTSNADLTGAQ